MPRIISLSLGLRPEASETASYTILNLARPNQYRDVSYLLAVAVAVIVIADALPCQGGPGSVALAMLFSFLLTPAVIWLERIRFPRALAVSFVVVVFVAAMGSVGWTVADQLVDVTSQLQVTQRTSKIKLNRSAARRPEY